MLSTDRRALLAGVAGLVGLAGCAEDRPRTVETSSDPDTDRPETEPPATGRLVLDPIAPDAVDGPLTVLPDDLRGWLRQAAAGDATIHDYGSCYVYPARQTYEPVPPLIGFDRVRLDDSAGDASGVYDLGVEGGVRYERIVGVDDASPPDEAGVTHVSDLPDGRRELALAAIGAESDHDGRVFPETGLGTWVRTDFFGGYFRYDGTTYRGHEVQQTDAAFSASEVWYVFSLSPVGSGSAPTLHLGTPSERARAVVDDLRSEHEVVERMEHDVEGQDAVAAETLAAEHPSLLTHDAVYRVTFTD